MNDTKVKTQAKNKQTENQALEKVLDLEVELRVLVSETSFF